MTIHSDAPTAEELKRLTDVTITGYVVTVSPEMAARWLKANVGNRSVRDRHVIGLRDEILEGRWKITHQGIAFDSDGRLLDGQHRLKAIIASGRPATLPVFVELSSDVFGALDRGRIRGIRDFLLDRDPRAVDTASFLTGTVLMSGSTANRSPSAEEVRRVLEVFSPDIEAMLEAAGSTRGQRTTAPVRGAWALRHHLAGLDDRRLLTEQWRAFVNFDVKGMDQTTATMVRRLQPENLKKVSSGYVTVERAVIGWFGFNPRRRNLTRFSFDYATVMTEMREALEECLTSPNAPTSDTDGPSRKKWTRRSKEGQTTLPV